LILENRPEQNAQAGFFRPWLPADEWTELLK